MARKRNQKARKVVMNRIIIALLAFLALIGCRTRKTTIEEQKQFQKERIIKYKDSMALFQQNTQTLQLDTYASQEYEVTVESDKDSIGNSKELVYYRIRDGDNETIRVSGGKAVIRVKSEKRKAKSEIAATLTNTISATNNELRNAESTTAFSHKTKNVKSSYLYLIAIIVVLLLVFHFIRNKLKRFLK